MSRTCHFCNATVEEREFCAKCTESFPVRANHDEMTGDERAAEMVSLGGPLEVPFSLLHERIERLVGRPVFTHEMVARWDELIEEARTRKDSTADQIFECLCKS